ncbi:MAG: pseudouridine synthase [Actinomycetota bacterium]|nr:pseudouridine synthase [Actinomycetota bacterium]
MEIDGVPLPIAPDLAYFAVYKPVGTVSTADDPQGRPTVVDLIPDGPRVYPAGRLDADSEGLMVLTNDGDLTLRITHPRFGVHKTYVVLVSGVVETKTIHRLTSGVDLEDGPARAVSARIVDRSGKTSLIEITMGEGRKRIVRRMFDVVGYPVQRLVRTSIGPLRDTSLSPGQCRPLTIEEIRALYQAGEEAPGEGSEEN